MSGAPFPPLAPGSPPVAGLPPLPLGDGIEPPQPTSTNASVTENVKVRMARDDSERRANAKCATCRAPLRRRTEKRDPPVGVRATQNLQ